MPGRRIPSRENLRVGWREWVRLPELRVDAIKAKIDTGARTSALHAYRIEPFRREGELWVRFEIHPVQRSDAGRVICEARAVDERQVRNSGGQVEQRYVIETVLSLGNTSWSIELALTNRDPMGFRMLLGRTALKRRVMIEPGRSFLLGPTPFSLRSRRRSLARAGETLP